MENTKMKRNGILNIDFETAWMDSSLSDKYFPSTWAGKTLLVTDKKDRVYQLYQFDIERKLELKEFENIKEELLLSYLFDSGEQNIETILFDIENISTQSPSLPDKIASLDLINLGFIFTNHPGRDIINRLNSIHKVWTPGNNNFQWNENNKASVISVSGEFFFQRQKVLSHLYDQFHSHKMAFALGSDSPQAPLYGIPYLSLSMQEYWKNADYCIIELIDFTDIDVVQNAMEVDIVIDNDDIFLSLINRKRKKKCTSTYSFIESSFHDMTNKILRFYSRK